MTHRTGLTALLLALVLLFTALSAFPAAGAEGAAGNTGALLLPGAAVNTRIKSLAAGEEIKYWLRSDAVRAIRMADALPEGFVPSEENTVSTEDSAFPAYIFYDNTDDAGILYFYTEGDRIILNPDSAYLFVSNTSLNDISGLACWDASQVKDMTAMFGNAISLTSAVALKDWDTSEVLSMRSLFSNDSALVFADVSGWNTGRVTTMANMFQVGRNYKGDGQLIDIAGLGDLDVSSVRDMTCMFYGAGQMTFYDVSRWDVSKVESMNHMFCDNLRLRSLDLSAWDVSSVKTMYCMFNDNHELRTIGDVSRWNTASLVDAGSWLCFATSFTGDKTGRLDLSGWNTSSLKSAGEMFYHTKIRTIDLFGWDFSSITNDLWEGAGDGIYYEAGNQPEDFRGLGAMFRYTIYLSAVYVSQSGLDSFNEAVERGVNTLDLWRQSKCYDFTVK